MNIVIQMQTCDHAQYSICHLILFYFILGSPQCNCVLPSQAVQQCCACCCYDKWFPNSRYFMITHTDLENATFKKCLMAGNSMCGRVGLNVTLLWLYLFRHRYRILPEVSYHLRCIKLETKHSTKQTKAEHEAVSPYELSAQAK